MKRPEFHLRPLLGFGLLLLATAIPLQARTLSKEALDARNAITAVELRKHLEFLSSEELGGRYTLSPSLAIVNRYLASRLRSYGYDGAVGGSFLQPYRVRQWKTDRDRTRVEVIENGRATVFDSAEFLVVSGQSGAVSGEVVFAGYGLSRHGSGRDDYAGIEVRDKIVLLRGDLPGETDTSVLADDEYGAGAAFRHGASAVLALPSGRLGRLANNPEMRERFLNRRRIELADSATVGLQLTLFAEVADRLLKPLGLDSSSLAESAEPSATTPTALNASMKLTVSVDEQIHTAANVAGILRGSDPALRDEYIVLSAHQDHLASRSEGQIFPGADDDGSGTVAVLGIAKALAEAAPRRSVLVMFHSGEENGLLGSRYNTDVKPVVPLESMVVDLNMDMIGRSKKNGGDNPRNRDLADDNTVFVIGADRISRRLHELNEAINREFTGMELDYRFNDPTRPERYYFRSDHWNYAKKNIPIAFFFTGTHEDYHRPTDTLDKIDFNKMTRIARHVFALAWTIAEADQRLPVD